MEAALLALLLTLGVAASDANFYGSSISFAAPKWNKNGTFTVTAHHRQNGRKVCGDQAPFRCDGGACSGLRGSEVAQTDGDDEGRWCQSESVITATVQTTRPSFALRSSGCCWLANTEGRTAWSSVAELDLGVRSDKLGFNRCPVTATVAALRLPQDCSWSVPLLAHDPDGDQVKCSFAADAAVPLNVSLDQAACTLTATGRLQTGVHVLELLLEDFPTTNLTLTYANGTAQRRDRSSAAPLCRVKLQFWVEVLPPVLDCRPGALLPVFLSPTPPHLSVLHATVGQSFQLAAAAQAHGARIRSFQVSGPSGMNKTFTRGQKGGAEVSLRWVPQPQDAQRSAPLCFTAETNASQSEMRCVVVVVTQSTHRQGVATVRCLPNRITVTLEKASMPGLDTNYLKLRDPTCSLAANLTHIVGVMSFTTCGTRVQEDGDYLVFSNAITSFQLPSEVVVRRRSVSIDFSCRFPKLLSVSSAFNTHDSDYVFTQSNFGTFGYRFDIYDDGNFTSKVPSGAYPVPVELLQTVYLGIQAQSELPNVQVFVESCKGTPDDNSDNPVYYDLIKDGCVKDETLRVHPSKQTAFNFEVQSFKFTDYEQVYITCYLMLCRSDSLFSRCAQGCVKSPARRRRQEPSLETERHAITQGPLRVREEGFSVASTKDEGTGTRGNRSDAPGAGAAAAPKTSSDQGDGGGVGRAFLQALGSGIGTIVLASLFAASLLLLIAVVLYFTRKKRAEDRRFLLDSSGG